jgi:hypothetical protein
MMTSEEKFFRHVKETMSGYAPEVPAAVYGRMRRKLWLSRFLTFDASRLNIWYLLLAAGITGGVMSYCSGDGLQADRGVSRSVELKYTVRSSGPRTMNLSEAVNSPHEAIHQIRPVSRVRGQDRQETAGAGLPPEIADTPQPVTEVQDAGELISQDKVPESEAPETGAAAPQSDASPKGRKLSPAVYKSK